MMAGSHVALGAAAWLAAAPALGLAALDPVSLTLAVAGSLLPDIDHPKSWFGKRSRPLSNILSAVFGHRGATHSLLAVAGCIWLSAQEGLRPSLIAPLVIGYLSHLVADLLTPGGLRLLWPLRGTWSLPVCRTGSPMEPLVVALILTCAFSYADGRTEAERAWRWLASCRGEAGRIACGPLSRPSTEPARRVASAQSGTTLR